MDVSVTKIQRFSTHDGPGIRTTVFLKGCPLTCRWCHNPETQLNRPAVWYIAQKCIGCGACLEVCQHAVHRLNERQEHIVDFTHCTGCLQCTQVCNASALEPISRKMTTDEILGIVLKDKEFYGDTGGITLSGGEPLWQADECLELLRRSKEFGMSTAVETSGFFDERFIEQLAPVTDLFLWDFKDGNENRHKENTGVSNMKILHNLRLLDRQPVSIILRCIMIKGINMDDSNYDAIAGTFSGLTHCAGVELLPYHPYGGTKNRQLGYEDNGRPEWIPDSEDIKTARIILQNKGVFVQ